MAHFLYRLQLLLSRKEEAKKEAEEELAQTEQEFQDQSELLQSLISREKKLIEKREHLRRELLIKPAQGEALTSREVLDRSEYVRVVGFEVEDANNDVLSQRVIVEQSQLRMQEAKNRAEVARREVEVLTKHRAKQQERFLREMQAQEEIALDEIGNVLYTTRRHPI